MYFEPDSQRFCKMLSTIIVLDQFKPLHSSSFDVPEAAQKHGWVNNHDKKNVLVTSSSWSCGLHTFFQTKYKLMAIYDIPKRIFSITGINVLTFLLDKMNLLWHRQLVTRSMNTLQTRYVILLNPSVLECFVSIFLISWQILAPNNKILSMTFLILSFNSKTIYRPNTVEYDWLTI